MDKEQVQGEEVNQTPPSEEIPQDTQSEVLSEEDELSAIEAELEQARASIEKDFAAYMANKTDEQMEELFFENKIAFYEAILQEQNAFLQSTIEPKMQRAQALRGDIAQKKQFQALEQAKEAFLQNHPDADIESLMQFYLNDLPPRVAKELEALFPSLEFFERVFELMNASNPSEETQEEKLPQQIQGQGVSAEASPSNESLPFERF